MLSVSFSPLIPAYALVGRSARSRRFWPSSPSCRADRWRSLRAVALGLVLLALANPSLVQEEREKVKDIVAVVIDRSTSQTLGDRRRMTDAGPRRAAAPLRLAARRRAALHRGATTAAATTARGCSRRCPTASPTCRRTGSRASIMVTDGVVHDIPASAAAPRLPGARCTRSSPAARTSATGDQAARGAALRHRRQGPDDPGRRSWSAAAPARRSSPCAATARIRAPRRCSAGAPFSLDGAHRAWRRRTWSRSRSKALPDELTPANNRAVVHDRGHPREAARAARLRRAACGRAHLAQPPEVGRQRRPRPLHHPAPAREAGRHADQRAVADRLPDARAVPAEDQGVRPHHLRPLRQPERPAARAISTTSCATCARAARCWWRPGPEFAGAASLAQHAAVADHSRRRRTGASSRSPTRPRITDTRQAPSGHPRAAGLGARQPPAWGEWLRHRRRAGPAPARP